MQEFSRNFFISMSFIYNNKDNEFDKISDYNIKIESAYVYYRDGNKDKKNTVSKKMKLSDYNYDMSDDNIKTTRGKADDTISKYESLRDYGYQNENEEITVHLMIQNQRDDDLYFSLVDPSCFGEKSVFKPFINQENWVYDYLHKGWTFSLEIQAHQKLEISYSYRKDQ